VKGRQSFLGNFEAKMKCTPRLAAFTRTG
jgi:hypothetical protein